MINIKKRRKQRMILAIIACILGIAFIGLVISMYLSTRGANNVVNEEPQNQELPITTSIEENRNLQTELAELNESYINAKAWLKVPGTSIDTVVFQAEDNDRYLRNDRDNVTTRWGENFLDYRCNLKSIKEANQNVIIYGHNTEVDTRFTPLLDYKNEEFFKEHQIIELATADGYYTFQIFTAYLTTTDFYYIDTKFKDAEDFGNFVASLKGKSLYDTKIEVSADDTILTLSTCDYSISNGRFVVQAKLIK